MPRRRPVPVRGSARCRTWRAHRRFHRSSAGCRRARQQPATIITLTGSGFARTIEVRFLGQTGGSHARGVPRGLGPRAQGGGSRRGCHDRPAAHGRRDHRGTGGHRPAESDDSPHRRLPVFRRNPALLRAALLWIGSGDMVGSVASQSIFIAPGGWSPRPRRTASTSSSTTAGWATRAESQAPSSSSRVRSFPIASNARRSDSRSRHRPQPGRAAILHRAGSVTQSLRREVTSSSRAGRSSNSLSVVHTAGR